jgi:hypothetical protein
MRTATGGSRARQVMSTSGRLLGADHARERELEMSMTVRASLVGLLTAGVLLLAGVASARAELRTAHYQNTDPVSTGSATDPQVQSVLLDYDSSGTLTAQVRFFQALADPQQTSGLHEATVSVLLGDAYGGDGFPDCERGRDGIYVNVGLGEGLPSTVSYTEFSPPLNVPVLTSLTPDRTELDITVQDARFANLNLICWQVDAENPADPSDQLGSLTGFRLMDGYTPQDGDLAYVGNEDLDSEATYVNNNLGHVKNPVFFSGNAFKCRPDGFGGVRCRGARRMPSIVGKPTLSIHGTQYFTTGTVQGGEEELAWHHDEHATLSWHRCPAAIHPPSRLIGRPCHVTVHWTDTRELYTLL